MGGSWRREAWAWSYLAGVGAAVAGLGRDVDGGVVLAIVAATLAGSLAVSTRRAWLRQVAFFCCGMALALARAEELEDCLARLDGERPARVDVWPSGLWSRSRDGGWTAWGRLLQARQAQKGAARVVCSTDLRLSLAGDEPPPTGMALRVRGFVRRNPGPRNLRPARAGPWRLHVKSRRLVDTLPDRVGALDAWRARVRARLDQDVAGAAATERGRRGLALARALALGDRGYLDPGIQRQLRRAGLAHLLAVSGLHAGLLAAALYGLLWPLPAGWRRLGVGLGLAAYVALAGASPATLRAGGMAGIGLLAFSASRRPQAARALALVAVVLATLDPGMLRRLGLQLTLAATAGIVFLSPQLEERWCPNVRTGWSRPGNREVSAPESRVRWDRPERSTLGFRGGARWLRRSIAASVGAQLATLPWTAGIFAMVHPLGPLLNLAAVPWLVPAVLLSLAAVAAAPVSTAAASALLHALEILARPLEWLVLLPVGPWSTVPVSWTPLAGVVVAVGLVVALTARPKAARIAGAVILGTVLCLGEGCRHGPAVVPAGKPFGRFGRMLQGFVEFLPSEGFLGGAGTRARSGSRSLGGSLWGSLPTWGPEVFALDVGQGDAFLLRDRDVAILIDGGGWRRGDLGGRVLVPVLAGLGIRSLDLAVVSHADADHCNGIRDLSAYVPIRELWVAPSTIGAACIQETIRPASDRWPGADRLLRGVAGVAPDGGARVARIGRTGRRLAGGGAVRLGSFRLEVLRASVAGSGERSPSDNDRSLVVRVDAGGTSLLFPGDLEATGERLLLAGRDRDRLDVDVLKVGHHGSRSSSSRSFVKAVSPRLAIVAAGHGNRYGHPHPEVLVRLRSMGAKILRTDRDGLIRLPLGPRRAR